MIFSKLALAVALIASFREVTACTNCAELKSKITCSVVPGNDGTSVYTFDLSAVKPDDTISWVCTRNIVSANPTCDGTSVDQNKCNDLSSFSATIDSSLTSVTIQVHDGQICGDVAGNPDPNGVDASGMTASKTCGGYNGCRNGDGCVSGVCNVQFDKSECEVTTESTCVQADCDAMNTAGTCVKYECGTGGQCVAVPREKDYVCRAKNGVCDVEEKCDGENQLCPADAFAKDVPCRPKVYAADGTSCDVEDVCDGSQRTCPPDAFESSGVTCRSSVLGSDGKTCDVAEMCTGTSAVCPPDVVSPEGTQCRTKADNCDVPEVCDGSSKSCPEDIRRTHGYTYKCSTTIYVCGVTATMVDGLQGLTVGSGGQSFFGSCGIGKGRSIVALDWPACTSQCVNAICQNNRGLSNYAYGSCVPETSSWYCEGKYDVGAPTGCYTLPWQG